MKKNVWFWSGVVYSAACVLAAFGFGFTVQVAAAQGFTIEQALSAPFTMDLRAAPVKRRVAWVANIGGRRNLWVAEPGENGRYRSRQITNYAEDDGHELSAPQWSADAETIVYVRGESAQGETHPVPNPAWTTQGGKQQI